MKGVTITIWNKEGTRHASALIDDLEEISKEALRQIYANLKAQLE